MRDRARQRALASARSRRASPEELKEAGKRVKEIEQEMRELELRPETRKGEERAQRYGRLLRLRRMREAFTATRPQEEPRPLNSIALSLVMLFASVALCAFCVGGAYAGLIVLQQKPDPIATASAFWDTMETQKYSLVESTYLSPALRVQYSTSSQSSVDLFAQTSQTADTNYGIITNATLIQQSGDMKQTAILTYLVQRNASYKATIVLRLHGGSWGIDDLGNVLAPDKAGLPEPTPSPSPTSPPTPTYPPSPTSLPSPSASP